MAKVKSWLSRFLGRTLLLAYTLFLLKPVMPVISDALAHAFWKNVHLATVHVVNGKEHVHYELANAAKEGGQDKSGPTHKAATENTDHIAVALPAVPAPAQELSNAARQAIYYRRTTHPDAELTITVPPPRAGEARC